MANKWICSTPVSVSSILLWSLFTIAAFLHWYHLANSLFALNLVKQKYPANFLHLYLEVSNLHPVIKQLVNDSFNQVQTEHVSFCALEIVRCFLKVWILLLFYLVTNPYSLDCGFSLLTFSIEKWVPSGTQWRIDKSSPFHEAAALKVFVWNKFCSHIHSLTLRFWPQSLANGSHLRTAWRYQATWLLLHTNLKQGGLRSSWIWHKTLNQYANLRAR